MRATTNTGGSLENRCSLREVAEAVTAVVGEEHRRAPGAADHPAGRGRRHPASHLPGRGAYCWTKSAWPTSIAEADWEDAPAMPAAFKETLRIVYRGSLIYSGMYTKARAEKPGQGLGRPDRLRPAVHRQP
ncbi:hypothetical protein P4234_29320 [Pseudomonas aeruginosa]|nr:hypothetical protein [Pseudomonas aeruginosa]